MHSKRQGRGESLKPRDWLRLQTNGNPVDEGTKTRETKQRLTRTRTEEHTKGPRVSTVDTSRATQRRRYTYVDGVTVAAREKQVY
jgi:hypothetical protein